MKAINITSFGNNGSAFLISFFSDYWGVGFLNLNSYETGAFKCQCSFGGIVKKAQHNTLSYPLATKEQLRNSLLGQLPSGFENIPLSEKINLNNRKELALICGKDYVNSVEHILASLPYDLTFINYDDLYRKIKLISRNWLLKVGQLLPAENFLDVELDVSERVVVLKNDPAGCYPSLSPLIAPAKTLCVLKNPINSYYEFCLRTELDLNDVESTINFVKYYCSQLQEAKKGIGSHLSHVSPFFRAVEFESFLESEIVRQKVLHQMIGNTRKIRSSFNEELMSRWVNKSTELSTEIIKELEEKCGEIYNTLVFILKRENMLIA